MENNNLTMEESIEKCTGNWMIENIEYVWTFKYFFLSDWGCRFFEIDPNLNLIIITSAIDNTVIKTISIDEFKSNFGDKVFLNTLYYKVRFPNVGFECGR